MTLDAFLYDAFNDDDNIQAIGDGADGPVMFVLDDAPALMAPYTRRADNLTVIKLAGPFTAPPPWEVTPAAYKDRRRPVPGGISIGNHRITAGTKSCDVIDNATGEKMLLSNWHILKYTGGVKGDEILQPGVADGGTRPADTIARLEGWVDVNSELTVTVDCAKARYVDPAFMDENIIALGKPHGMTLPYLGQWLKKSGRTTETTAGDIAVIDATVKVGYGGFTKSIQKCFLTGVPGAGGDSGSLYMDYGNGAVGLLFAGGFTDDGYAMTIGCRMDEIERQLNVTVSTPSPRQKRHGIDVSKWQGEMNWQKAKDAGVSVAMIRAGSIDNVTGECYEDFQFQRNAELAPPLMPVGFYWYFRPNHSAIKQADYFCELIKDANWLVPPAIDVEEDGGKSPAEIASAVWSFLNRVYLNTGERPMVYTSPGFWDSYVARSPWARDYPLWVANWVNLGVMVPLLPLDWKGVGAVMWQYRVARGSGEHFGAQSPDIDLNTTYPAFEALLDGETPPPPPPPPPTPPDEKAEFTHNKARALVGLNYRTGPGTQYARVGTLKVGAVVDVLKTQQVGANTWADLGSGLVWGAMEYNGADYLDWVMEGEPVAMCAPEMRPASWLDRLRYAVASLFGRGSYG